MATLLGMRLRSLLVLFALALAAARTAAAVPAAVQERGRQRAEAEARVVEKLALLEMRSDPLEGLEEPTIEGGEPHGCVLLFNLFMGQCTVAPASGSGSGSSSGS